LSKRAPCSPAITFSTQTDKQQNQKRKEYMNNKFDELAKGMAQSVTRRAALKKFSAGLAGMALACLGLANKAEARNPHGLPSGSPCRRDHDCCSRVCHRNYVYGDTCQ
jgi:hypothetical protein